MAAGYTSSTAKGGLFNQGGGSASLSNISFLRDANGDFSVSGNLDVNDTTTTPTLVVLSSMTVSGVIDFSGASVLDLGIIDTVDINGGTIDGTTIGASVPDAGTFTSIVASTADIDGGTLDGVTIGSSVQAEANVTTLNSLSLNATSGGSLAGTWTTLGTVTTMDLNGGTIDGTVIGGTTPAAVTTSSLVATTADINGGNLDGTIIGGASAAAGSFTTLSASGILTADLSSIASSGDLAVADGGTGASTAAAARTNLDVDQAGTALALAIALG